MNSHVVVYTFMQDKIQVNLLQDYDSGKLVDPNHPAHISTEIGETEFARIWARHILHGIVTTATL